MAVGLRISLTGIILLTILSYGLYALYWTYITWKQYHDHSGRNCLSRLARAGPVGTHLRMVPVLRPRQGIRKFDGGTGDAQQPSDTDGHGHRRLGHPYWGWFLRWMSRMFPVLCRFQSTWSGS